MGLTGLNGHGRGSPVESKASQPPADGERVQDTRKAIYSQGGLQGNKAVPDKEGFWWPDLLTETSWEANSCGRCFPPHCAVQALARCTEIRGDLEPTVFSRWPRAQQPPSRGRRRGFGVKIGAGWCQQVEHAAGRRLILWPICILRKQRLIFFIQQQLGRFGFSGEEGTVTAHAMTARWIEVAARSYWQRLSNTNWPHIILAEIMRNPHIGGSRFSNEQDRTSAICQPDSVQRHSVSMWTKKDCCLENHTFGNK